MDLPKGNMITSKREIQLETHRRKNICRLRTDGTETNCVEILKSPSDVVKNIVNIWIPSCQLISHTQPQEKSVEEGEPSYSWRQMVEDQRPDQ